MLFYLYESRYIQFGSLIALGLQKISLSLQKNQLWPIYSCNFMADDDTIA
ncbi:hypothetical protein Mettu_2805 [Methylobacter tundripaludum SV96]|uniref:Uncharacterized protein n=1 Tax=Methylobacter tundripaludum (strain ATCC BAA-1195 / DSM 17260 / SV96) TaxID=697282 RepID=G3J1U1_METTV|nr:hypothetical protein Mettu_2805 [Methylobacter tundripaludum SV96]